ncbi:MAG: pyridoxamine 5'-phosphate oxidase family protein [Steroidobacteraceae bacterium]
MDPALQAQIVTLLDQHRTMSVATLRPDGWPQATTVGFAHEGLTLYFLCGPDSQKAANLAQDDRVSLTIDHDPPQVMAITGLSMAARARRVTAPQEAEKALGLLVHRYSQQQSIPGPMPRADALCIFRVTPEIISVLDYSKGFGHAELVRC